jgi:hypothetical protein
MAKHVRKKRVAGYWAQRSHESCAWLFRGSVAIGLPITLFAALFLPITVRAGDQEKSTGTLPGIEGSLPPLPQNPVDQPASVPRWIISIEGIALERIGGGVNRTLAARVPGTVPFVATSIATGAEAFNSNQFQQGFSAGPEITAIYQGDSGYSVELSYFNVFNQSATKTIGPDNPADWLVMKAPGGFWQTQDFAYQAMQWSASTNLYSAEINGRLDLTNRLTVLAGIRWFQLNDTLQGTLTPTDQTAPAWKTTCPTCNLFQLTPDGPIGNLPPFWNAGTTNNLYGVQLGLDAKLAEFGRFSLGGRITVGLFDNIAEQSAGVSIRKVVYPTKATVNGAAFVSDASLQLRYRVMDGLSLKAGYEVLWLAGIALAPGQIDETYAAPSGVRALSVNHGSNVLFQGATFGLEYSF